MFICGIAALMIGMGSCKSNSKDSDRKEKAETLAKGDNSRNTLDWNGVYSGVIPCADCEGIRTTIELSGKDTYQMKQTYLGKDNPSYESAGALVWNEGGNIITIGKGEAMTMFAVGEDQLTMLDREGQRITGELADYYVLGKIREDLLGKYWKLTKLYDQPVTTAGGGKEAFLMLEKEDGRVSGNSGCNSFHGTYTVKPGQKIHFSQMVSTMMMCLRMETEKKMNEALSAADNFVLQGDTLLLNNAQMDPLALFVAVHEP